MLLFLAYLILRHHNSSGRGLCPEILNMAESFKVLKEVLKDESSSNKRLSVSKGKSHKILPIGELMKGRDEDWSIYSATQNLPSVLNDPNNRELDLFTKTWGETFLPYAPVPQTSLPNIELGDFLCYLRETASVSDGAPGGCGG